MKQTPGTLKYTAGIPTALVNDHNEVFFYWWKFGMKDAVLFHVDAHPDMDCNVKVEEELSSGYDYSKLSIANFICPAMYHGLISSVYWLNPHSIEKRQLQHIKEARSQLVLDQESSFINGEERLKYIWKYNDDFKVSNGEGYGLSADNLFIPQHSQLILDIDLDAFCCHRNESLRNLPEDRNKYEGVFGYERRIDETIDALINLPRPDLITIASSEGDGKISCFVPPFMIGEVSRYLAINLRNLYEK